MMHVKAIGAIWALIIFFTIAFVMLFQPTFVGHYDEAVMLLGAMQVQESVFPGSGFYSVYGPLQYYVSAVLLTLFDGNIISLRLYHAMTVCVTLLTLASVLQARATFIGHAMVTLFLFLGIYGFSRYNLPLYPTHMLAFFCAVFIFATVTFRNASAWQKVFGLATFNMLLILLDPLRGAMIVMMQFIAVPFQKANIQDLSRLSLSKAFGRLGIACALSAAGLIIHELITDGSTWATVQFLFTDQIPAYATHRWLPIPTFSVNTGAFLPFYVPPTTLLVGGAVYLYGLCRPERTTTAFQLRLFWLLFFCAALYPSGFVRSHVAQLLPANLFAVGAIILIVNTVLERVGWRFLPLFIFLHSALFWTSYAFDRLARSNNLATDCDYSDLSKSPMSCLRVGSPTAWEERQVEVAALDEFLAPQERLYVALDSHDRFHSADLTYYFLLGRLPLTRWAHIEPGIHTTTAVQLAIIEELETQISTNSRAVVVVQPAKLRQEPNLSAVSSGITILDEYIAKCELYMTVGKVDVRRCQQVRTSE